MLMINNNIFLFAILLSYYTQFIMALLLSFALLSVCTKHMLWRRLDRRIHFAVLPSNYVPSHFYQIPPLSHMYIIKNVICSYPVFTIEEISTILIDGPITPCGYFPTTH